jgi:hypothetical protein
LIDDLLRVAGFDQIERMLMNVGGPDEFLAHQADAIARKRRVFFGQIRVAEVHIDLGAGDREGLRDNSSSGRGGFGFLSSTMPL